MDPRAVANVLGALAQAIADRSRRTMDEGAASSVAALVHLSKYPGETIDALRKPLGLSHPGCVRLVDRLADDGLLERRQGADARSVKVYLTSRGKTAAKSFLARRNRMLRKAVATLSAVEQERLGRLVSKILMAGVNGEGHALEICRFCDYGACPDEDCPVTRALSASAGASA
jgi:MarR family transcriptional repressor of emrRAB